MMKNPMDWFLAMLTVVVSVWALATVWVEWGVLPALVPICVGLFVAARIGLLKVDPLWAERLKRG